MNMDPVKLELLDIIAGMKEIPSSGAFNIRIDGQSAARSSSEGISILPKENGSGIDIFVQPGVKGETVQIPVIISQTDMVETVYNDFHIGEGADVVIIAGCGVHNTGDCTSQHDGIHSFYLGENARVIYQEKHYGSGTGTGQRILNPVTKVYQEKGSYMEMNTVQIKGVDNTKRFTYADLAENATLIVHEKLMTHDEQFAETMFEVNLNGTNSSANVISRSVAKGKSSQVFLSKINGNACCMGHSECDAIIMDESSVKAIPEITANHSEASLIHEAAIGKIAGEQLTKLMTLGLTEQEAEAQIINGFLR